MIPFKTIVCIGLLLCVTGCSSLLYFPDKKYFTNPSLFQYKPVDVEIPTDDGVKLHGWFFHSPTRPAKGTILFFHGNAQNISTHFMSLYWVLKEGYDFLIFDYRGYGQSPGNPSPEWTVRDGISALSYIMKTREPGNKLILFGESLGGAVALRVAAEAANGNATPYDEVIVESSFSSYKDVARSTLASAWLTWPFQWVAYLTFSDKWAPKGHIAQISPRPLLVIHGTNDKTVGFSLGQAIFEEAKEPKSILIVEGGQHIDALMREGGKYRKPFLDWIQNPTIDFSQSAK